MGALRAWLLLVLLAACGLPAPPPPPAGCGACHAPHDGPPQGVHAALSCDRCHLGDPAARAQEAAHAGLEREPGALSTVGATCGAAGCHQAQAERVLGSLMATNAGIAQVARARMGEAPRPGETLQDALAATDPTPAQDHLRRLCGGCHLHARKDNRDDAMSGIGSGCSACHSRSRGSRWEAHPSVDLVVPDDRCLGCHSRSGRISLGYQGLAELRGRACEAPVTLHDGRPGCRLEADVHQRAGLGCADCHLHTELMGDGAAHEGQAQAVELRCESCHGPGAAERTWAQVEDPTSRTLLRMHGQARDPAEPVRVGTRGTPLWNLRPDGAGWALSPKGGGPPRTVPPTPADLAHALPGHERLACATCHTAWAPVCADCHTRFDPGGEQWDFGQGAVAAGAWVEEGRVFSWGAPALGLTADGRIDTFAPGMISSLDASAAGGPVGSERRFSRVRPHTTGAQARSCASCHRDPAALGLGTGDLDLVGLRFSPADPDPDSPALARDGWVALQPAAAADGARPGQRSLDAAEQRRVLRVGLCLDCHPTAQDPIYRDFAAARARLDRPSACRVGRLPAWARR